MEQSIIRSIPEAVKHFRTSDTIVICEKINGERHECKTLIDAIDFFLGKQELTLPTNEVTTINVDELKPNSVIVIKLDVKTPEEKMMAMPSFAKLINPYAQTLRDKRITVMIMSKNESIDVISEAEMNNSGWFKKEKPLIINPFDKK